MATRYSWFLTSLGTPTFMAASPLFVTPHPAPLPGAASLTNWAPGGPRVKRTRQRSAVTRLRRPQAGEAAAPSGVRGQDTHGGRTIVQVAGEEPVQRLVQAGPAELQLGLLVPGYEVALRRRDLHQVAGQEDADPLGADARGGVEVDQNPPVAGPV